MSETVRAEPMRDRVAERRTAIEAFARFLRHERVGFGFLRDSEAGCRSGERPIFRSLKRTLSPLTGWLHYMPPDPVVAASDTLEARFTALGIGGQSPLHGRPAQWLARELLCRRVDLACPHRLPGQLEYQRHGLEYWAHLGGSRPRFTRIDQGPAEQSVVERAEPRELNPESRVRTCPV